MSRIHSRRIVPSSKRAQAAWVLYGALLGNLHDAGEAIERCAADRGRDALFQSQALWESVLERLEEMSCNARELPAEAKAGMPRIDWCTWEHLPDTLAGSPRERRDRLTFVIDTLVPDTLVAAEDYRRALQPQASRV